MVPASPAGAVLYHSYQRENPCVIRSNLDRSPMYAGVIEGVAHATARRSKTKSCASPTEISSDLP